MKKYQLYRQALAILFVTVIIVWVLAPRIAKAFWNADQAVHIQADQIENSTLVIGTHLIHISALTDELYEIAQKSAGESMQSHIYYKSELAEGTWFDITTASSLADITTGGTPASPDEINKLYFEYHTKSDGKTYDLRTQMAVNIYDILSPYELEAMEELLPMKLQYDMLNEKEQTEDVPKWIQEQMSAFFRTDVKTAVAEVTDPDTQETVTVSGSDTADLDAAIDGLGAYLAVLKEHGGGEEEKAVIDSVLGSLDASRRLITCQIVYSMAYKQMETFTGSNDQLPKGYTVDAMISNSVNDSMGNLNNSILEYSSKVLQEGATVLSSSGYQLKQQLISAAKAGDMASCDEAVDRLIMLDHITNGTVVDSAKELLLLQDDLLIKAAARYSAGLSAGENSDYMTAKAGNSARVLLESIAAQYAAEVDSFRNELEFLIDARCMRVSNEAAQDYIGSLLETAPEYYPMVAGDVFFDGCRESIDGYIEWLNQKLASLVKGGGGTESDLLKNEKSNLQKDYMKALDQNDLKTAKELSGQIERVGVQISDMETAQAEKYSQLQTEIAQLQERMQEDVSPGTDGTDTGGTGTDGTGGGLSEAEMKQLKEKQLEAAQLKAGMSADGIGGKVSDLRSEGLKQIGEGDVDGLNQSLAALGDMLDLSYKTAFPALTDIYSAMVKERDLNASKTYEESIARVETLILNNKAAYDQAMQPVLPGAEIQAKAGEFFNEEDKTKWSSEQEAEYLGAIQMYLCDSQDKSILAAAAEDAYQNGNPWVYLRINDPVTRYIPVPLIGSYAQLRYLWSPQKSTATLAAGSRYYEFIVFSDKARLGMTQADFGDMKQPAQFKDSVHIPEDYAYEEFGCGAVYIDETPYAVLTDARMQEQSESLLEILMGGVK